jgi:hypothetical protein
VQHDGQANAPAHRPFAHRPLAHRSPAHSPQGERRPNCHHALRPAHKTSPTHAAILSVQNGQE